MKETRHDLSLVLGCAVAAVIMAASPGFSGTQEAAYGARILLEIPWGSGPWSAGRLEAHQSAPEGPMSFAVSQKGDLFVLDQVNTRILAFDPAGEPALEIPLDSSTYQDIAVDGSGTLILLDRLVGRCVDVVDETGAVLFKMGIESPWIPEGGGVTAMFSGNGGVWLEVEHARLVRVLDEALNPSPPALLPGRFVHGENAAVNARLTWPVDVTLEITGGNPGAQSREKTFLFDDWVFSVSWLETDAKGNIYLMLNMVDRVDPLVPAFREIAAWKIDGEMTEKRRIFSSTFPPTEWEQFKAFHVFPDGSVFQMVFSDESVRILDWREP